MTTDEIQNCTDPVDLISEIVDLRLDQEIGRHEDNRHDSAGIWISDSRPERLDAARERLRELLSGISQDEKSGIAELICK